MKQANQTIHKPRGSYSRGEELSHWISHGVGFLGAVAGTPVLIVAAVRHGGAFEIVAASVFGLTAMLLYIASTIYHALPEGRAKNIFEVLDHAAIYLLIAGTYTPFTLGVLRGAFGWTLFGLIWALALGGVALKSVQGIRYPKISVGLYVGMGWLVLIAIRPLMQNLPPAGLLWLAGGGIAYTAGVAFYVAKRLRFAHFVWHLFVLLGTVCHYFAILWYATGRV